MENLIITKEVQSKIDDINNTPYFWASIPLADHNDLPQFNRKLVISGFNFPDLEDSGDERLELTIKQIFTNKSTGKVFKAVKLPTETIYAFDESSLLDSYGNPIKGDLKKYDDEGVEISSEKVEVKVNTVKLLKYNFRLVNTSITEILEIFLKKYAELNSIKLEEI